MRRKNKKYFLFALLLSIFGVVALDAPAYADNQTFIIETGCTSQPDLSFTGILPLPQETYDVYVRLGKRGQTANVAGYARENSQTSTCQPLGSVEASGDEWRLLGTFDDGPGEAQTIMQLVSPLFTDRLDANRPSLMLVTHDTPLCRPTVECEVRVGDQTGFVRPGGTLLNQNSLRVVRVVDPKRDAVQSVRYYADDHLLYTGTSLETFDVRYISHQGQRLSRVVEYKSGQQVIFEQIVPDTFLDTFPNFVFKMVRTNPGVVSFLAWFAGAVTILAFVRAVAIFFERRRQWKYAHGFLQHMSASALSESDKRRMKVQGVARNILKVATWLAVIVGVAGCIIFFTNAFVAQIYSVDGQSMESTFHDRQRMIVNKVPRAIANLNRLEYVPKRGDVVVTHMVFGVTASDSEDQEASTIVKRVLGLPGERVVVENGTLTVYNKEHPGGFQPDKGASWEKTMHRDTSTERLEVTLGAAELFVSGDNRPESIDSRFNGPINVKQVVGPVLFQRAF